MNDIAIKVENVSKMYRIFDKPEDRLKDGILWRWGKRYGREFWALRDISFEVKKGESVGIIGRNGSGKSTLLQIIAGTLQPTGGNVHVDGRIAALLELGSGFNPEYTGRENIMLNACLLGFSRKEIEDRIPAITAFADIENFLEQPVKFYSSGMLLRIAFATAIHATPQTFIVDEALAVGDTIFQQRCMEKIKEFRNNGGSLIFVSHDMNAVKALCDRSILLNNGETESEGVPDDVINQYNCMIANLQEHPRPRKHFSKQATSFGNYKIRIHGTTLTNDTGIQADVLISGSPARISVEIEANENTPDVTVGICIRDRLGQDMFGTNTFDLKHPICLSSGERTCVQFDIPELNLGAGRYSITVAAHTNQTHIDECYEWIDNAIPFSVILPTDLRFIGVCRMMPHVHITPKER